MWNSSCGSLQKVSNDQADLYHEPAPFHSPEVNGFGWSEIEIPQSSAILASKKRARVRWSPMSIPAHGPTWNSHCDGMTSALIPEMLIPAYKQAR